MTKIHAVVGGQFGSEAKGAVAAFLSTQVTGSVIGVRVGGPNAGHTVMGRCHPRCTVGEHPDGGSPKTSHPWRLRQVPVLAVSHPEALLAIAQGSEVDIEVLLNEIDLLESAGYEVRKRLYVDRNATVIQSRHKLIEADADLTGRLGSTAKGIGAARADRIMRRANVVSEWTWDEPYSDEDLSLTHIPHSMVSDTVEWLAEVVHHGVSTIIIEGTQGYGLGLHTEYYPFTTSGDCRTVDLLAQCGLNPWATGVEVHTWLVVRPNPIRVAGNSGPLSGEMTWFDLGLPEELTTVTQKVRRVGKWDSNLVNDAIRANGGPSDRVHVVLSMLDHLVPAMRDVTHTPDAVTVMQAQTAVERLEKDLISEIQLVGTGPGAMMWYRHEGLAAVNEPNGPFRELRSIISNIQQSFGSFRQVEAATAGLGRRSFDVAAEMHAMTGSELEEWWLGRAQSEVAPMAAKAEEYGGKGAAVDLIDIGTDLARLMGRNVITTEEATELGIYFYLKGKFSRWTAALLEGRRVSDDTLLDIGVYVRMVQRTREVGGWPYGPDKEDS